MEVDHDAGQVDAARDWIVRLRRGAESVIIRRGLGTLSARAFATELRRFLGVVGEQEGAAIE